MPKSENVEILWFSKSLTSFSTLTATHTPSHSPHGCLPGHFPRPGPFVRLWQTTVIFLKGHQCSWDFPPDYKRQSNFCVNKFLRTMGTTCIFSPLSDVATSLLTNQFRISRLWMGSIQLCAGLVSSPKYRSIFLLAFQSEQRTWMHLYFFISPFEKLGLSNTLDLVKL